MSDQKSTQHHAWSSGAAADAYFERNRVVLDADRPPSVLTRFYASYIEAGDRVLEIGTANGRVLEQLRRLTNCEAYGIDPSPAAIEDGRTRYPQVRFSVGTADQLEYPDEFFDIVIFGFCLYLVERSILMRVVAESDRVLVDGRGKLMITDFDPAYSHRRPFKHQLGLWTYKMQYPMLWLANPAYTLMAKSSHADQGADFPSDPSERVAAWVLFKEGVTGYPEFP